MDSGLLCETKAILKSLVVSSPNNLTIQQLNRDYKSEVGFYIPYDRLGYKTIHDFLSSIPDIVRVNGNTKDAIVVNVASEKSKHIEELVRKQKKQKSRTKVPNRMLPSRNLLIGHMPVNKFSYNNVPQQNYLFAAPYMPPTYPLLNMQTIYGNIIFQKQLVQQQAANIAKNQATRLVANYAAAGGRNNFTSRNTRYTRNINNKKPNFVAVNQKSTKREQSFVQKNKTEEAAKIDFVADKLQNVRLDHEQSNEKPTSNYDNHAPTIQAVDQENNKQIKDKSVESENEPIYISSEESEKEVEMSAKSNEFLAASIKDRSASDNVISLLDASNTNNTFHSSVDATNNNNTCQSSADTSNTNNTCHSCAENTIEASDEDDTESDSSDEAIPLYAVTAAIFRGDLPRNVARFGHQITLPKLPDVQTIIRISVLKIESPEKFYFSIHTMEDEFNSLSKEMQHFYSSIDDDAYDIPTCSIQMGQLCAVYCDKKWTRATILAPPNSHYVKVHIMDYGIITEVLQSQIKCLLQLFTNLPMHALCGSLSNIKPSRGNRYWNIKATRDFASLVYDRIVYGKVITVDKETNITKMVICNTNESTVKQINTILITQGHAVYVN